MGLFQVLRSIEDLLYEVMTWLVFYPRTLWQTARHPVRMIDYSDAEQGDRREDQYTDALSPPLFLILSILLAHGLELTLHRQVDTPGAGAMARLLASDENLLILRAVLFSVFPLCFATSLLRRQGVKLDRATLRGPFFSQCYLGGLFALLISAAALITGTPGKTYLVPGLWFTLAIILWYVGVQSLWFREHLPVSLPKATGAALLSFGKGVLVSAAISSIFFA